MTRLRLRDVLDSTGAVLDRGALGGEVLGVSTDTRTLKQSELFLALEGPSFDGNRFAAEAVSAGAGALLLKQGAAYDEAAVPTEVPVLLHPQPRRALADLAAWHRSRLRAYVVGITGSCGKTTTKDMIACLFGQLMPVVASPSSYNNDIGVPHTVLLAEEATRLLAVEMGTNHPGEIAALCRIARPTAGIITNVGASHLEGLGSIEGVAREKGDLAASLPRDGLCILNADCRFTPGIRSRTSARVVTFSVEGKGDLDATDLFFHSGGTTFRLGGVEVTSPLLGTHNVQNLLAALCLCEGMSIPIEGVLPRIPELSGGRQRMERRDLGGVTLLDDTYNSNPDSLRAAVRVLAGWHGHRRRILVLGDMLELGELAAELHYELGREAALAGIDRLVLVGELAKAAAAGALEGGLSAGAVEHVEAVEEAAAVVDGLLEEGDVVLLKGSRGMRLEQIVAELERRRGGADQP